MRTFSTILLWSGRALALGCFAVWGTFFVEHLDWFLHLGQGVPPVRVWLLQLAHGTMLIGLLMLLRWEIGGGLLTTAAALVFFVNAAGPRFPLFFSVTVLPVVLVLLGRLLAHWAIAPPATP